jgi:saccharopine dehydrogenase (NADP+, L-glutamate forming)/spermidine synthase
MKRILVLGAGLVSKPGVRYLLNDKELNVTVASRTVSKAEKLVEGFDNGFALHVNVKNEDDLENLIKQNDIIVSLLPWIYHIKVAKLCLKNNKNMATTSYVSEEMKELDEQVKKKGLLFLNEVGVDPGIDHMSAMSIIDHIHEQGGKIVDFYSFCGGLPAPENNDNPFGYKFSWSPKGVLLASRNSAKFLEHGKIVEIDGKDLFSNYRVEDVDNLGKFEVYANRDSMPYRDIYGLNETETVMRGTYRYPGWCDTIKKIVDLGLIDETPRESLKSISFRNMIAELIGCIEGEDVIAKTAEKMGLSKDSEIIKRIEWLGLFSDDIVSGNNYLDILGEKMQEKMKYEDGERDMLILKHKFIVENKDKSRDMITSTMIDYGIPYGDTSMARTVSLPLGIGVKLMAENKIDLKGVIRPIKKEVYRPILKELEKLNIKLIEKKVRK